VENGGVNAEYWDRTDAFFGRFAEDADERGQMSAINLGLLRQARPRWESVLECHFIVGLGLEFRAASVARTEWVKVDPRVGGDTEPLVAVSLLTCRPFTPQQNPGGFVIAGDICRLATGPTVLESFLVQLGEPNPAVLAPG
jgi:hypothetical protein